MKNITVKKILTVCISVFLIIYVVCNLYMSNSKKISSETLIYAKVYDSYETTAYIVKDEDEIRVSENTNVYYLAKDGESVAAGEVIAYEFQDPRDVVIKEEIAKLNDRIETFEALESKSKSNSNNIEIAEYNLSQSIKNFKNMVENNEFVELKTSADNVLYNLNNKQIITGKTAGFDAIISQAQEELAALENELSGNIKELRTNSPGYFISKSADGLENKADYENILTVNYDELSNIMEQEYEIDPNIVGKTINGLSWYIVCKIPQQEASKVQKDKQIGVNFVSISNENIPVSVAAINRIDDENVTVVLKCNQISGELLDIRKENIKLNYDLYEGIKVPKNAVHMGQVTKTQTNPDGTQTEQTQTVQGVYTIIGDRLKFKEINPVFAYSEFMICNDNKDSEDLFSGDTVEVYDKVIIGGEDLYDGKFIG